MVDHVFHGEQRLTYLPERKREFQPEVDYFRANGITRAEGVERDRALRRHEFEGDAVSDLGGDPPEVDTKGLSPKRALYARYLGWRQKLERELKELEQKKADLEVMVAGQADAERELRFGVRQTAMQFLGRGEGNGEADAKALSDRVAVARHRAEAAKVALQELESDIDRARIRAAHVSGRESEFLFPALVEIADQAGLGTDYLNAIDKLRSATSLIFGLIEVVHSYGSGFERPQGPIKLPYITMPSVSATQGDFTINNRGARDVWERMADALRRDPRQNLVAFIKPPAPKGGYSSWPYGK